MSIIFIIIWPPQQAQKQINPSTSLTMNLRQNMIGFHRVVLVLMLALSVMGFQQTSPRLGMRRMKALRMEPETTDTEKTSASKVVGAGNNVDRRDLWKKVSQLERRAVQLLTEGDTESAMKLLAESVCLKDTDPFIALAREYGTALSDSKDSSKLLADETTQRCLADMIKAGVPPHLQNLSKHSTATNLSADVSDDAETVTEIVDPGSTFSDTVTEKIRVKVSSFYDADKSDPANGKYMFWYKVGIYNEGE